MKTKNILLSSLLFSFATTKAFAGWGGIDWPHVEWPSGIEIPPISDWKVGGDLGKLWENNKAALTMATLGGTVLGPLGWFYGFIEGHKTDEQMNAAKEMKARLEADEVIRQQIVEAGNRYPDQAQQISSAYTDAMKFLGERPATPKAAYDELNEKYWGAGFCLIAAVNANQADDCKFNFQDESRDIQKRFR